MLVNEMSALVESLSSLAPAGVPRTLERDVYSPIHLLTTEDILYTTPIIPSTKAHGSVSREERARANVRGVTVSLILTRPPEMLLPGPHSIICLYMYCIPTMVHDQPTSRSLARHFHFSFVTPRTS